MNQKAKYKEINSTCSTKVEIALHYKIISLPVLDSEMERSALA